jgi:hypothetical protein
MNEKVAAYLAAGAEEAWIILPRSRRCEFHAKEGILDRSRFAVELVDLFDSPAGA